VQVRRLEVITGELGRRHWSPEDKARILAEASMPGVVVSEVARRHGLRPQQVFGWRRQARDGELVAPGERPPLFVPAVPAREAIPAATPASDDVAAQEVVIEVGEIRLRIGAAVPAKRVAAIVAALRACR
jgi:transposase